MCRNLIPQCYHSVISSLKIFFRCPDFENDIDSWNRGPKVNEMMFDVYNGKIWQNMLNVREIPFIYSIKIKTHQCPNGTTIRAALLMIACDIPAARKVCGFTSHTSTNACHKCKHQFSRLAETSSVDYSGFDFSKWLLCTKNDNCKDAEVWKNATAHAERHRPLEK
ncbi:hypothetical protein PHYBLDRAFT_70329 [Phycomyces blakesleeanus NRRL 1555(-)]|uniref:Uncharacterized protein n=1 Tax=Phycomyces blakesleeanus (strain ATCC 8743b / DSM 1359 / FGSC 10004 / NBRC 33097 / NRRL 1555) TaxID=763407 RepID=A0A162WGF8_PHYB8|nr:hypothetical protein PHYBLDRAFT_70329 [Phycomyces blakesleeanus NRRL 1555(-)]OAD66975.1 hypothetical protein PHYBLDRAFT_70329 [Phycomyces blakesleeanus NRRL 1555(-)]|eukprot:XP_018285015.1 hypothetical protein PHYBLDRAFT_70329 [Phycomyces blakesleeanus NRRL 1555(-)]